MLRSVKIFSFSKKINLTNKLRPLNLYGKFFATIERRVSINKKDKGNLTLEQKQALETHREGFKKFVEFIRKREVYTWEDYLQQVIVREINKLI